MKRILHGLFHRMKLERGVVHHMKMKRFWLGEESQKEFLAV